MDWHGPLWELGATLKVNLHTDLRETLSVGLFILRWTDNLGG